MEKKIVNEVGIFLVGALVGGLIAMLYAPRSGREMRRLLRDELDVVRNDLGKVREDLDDMVKETKEKIKNISK